MAGARAPAFFLGLGLRLERRWGDEARYRLRSCRTLSICGV